MTIGQVWRSSALRHVLIEISLNPAIEGYLLRIEPIGGELDFNEEEALVSVYDEKVRRLRLRLTDEVRRFVVEYLNSVEIGLGLRSPTPVFPSYFIAAVHVVNGGEQFSKAIDSLYLVGTFDGDLICVVFPDTIIQEQGRLAVFFLPATIQNALPIQFTVRGWIGEGCRNHVSQVSV